MKNRIDPQAWAEYERELFRKKFEGKPLPANFCVPKELQSPPPVTDAEITRMLAKEIVARSKARYKAIDKRRRSTCKKYKHYE